MMLVFAVAGVRLGGWLRLPSRFFMGPWLVSMVGSHLLGGPAGVAPQILNVSLLLLGTWIGLMFDLAIIRRLARVVLISLLLVILTLFGTIGLAWIFSRLSGVSVFTAFMGSAPGAMEVMIALSMKLGIDPPLVVSLHVIRFLGMLLCGPAIARWLAGGYKGKGGEAGGGGNGHGGTGAGEAAQAV